MNVLTQAPRAIAHNATMGTGIAAADMYRMSRSFRDNCSVFSLTTNGHRVLHALLHRTCRDLPHWDADVQQPGEGHRARCKVLRHTLGLERPKGNRDLRAGISDLIGTNLFEWIGFCHRNSWLSWRFDDAVLSSILEGDSYGLLDASALRMFRTVLDYQVFNHVSVVRRTRKPEFTIPLEQAAIWTEKENPNIHEKKQEARRTCVRQLRGRSGPRPIGIEWRLSVTFWVTHLRVAFHSSRSSCSRCP